MSSPQQQLGLGEPEPPQSPVASPASTARVPTQSPACAEGPSSAPVAQRLSGLDWPALHAQLDAEGWARTGPLLSSNECDALAARWSDESAFRSRVVMARHGFGRGEYRYWRYPLPSTIDALRAAAYPRLAPLANRWAEALGGMPNYPDQLAQMLARCHADGQTRPTPLLLRYAEGDYNCLHQDLYGDQVFPLQLVVMLSQPGRDFDGGELVLTEQRPRMQSRVQVLRLAKGEAAIFAVRERPVRGTRGWYRVAMRHGVSRIDRGLRFTAGVIFHDAR